MRDKPSGGKAKNPGSPTAAAERQKRATTYGPTGGAQPRPTRGPGRGAKDSIRPVRGSGSMVEDRKRRNAGSEGPKRGMTAGRSMGAGAGSEGPKKQAPKYGPTGGAQPRPTRGPGRKATDVARPERGIGRGADDRNRPTRGPGRSNPKPKTDQQLIAEQRTLRAKLKGVDYDGLGRLLKAEGYGAYGRKAANTGRKTKTLPKTK